MEIGDFGVVNTGNNLTSLLIRWGTNSTVNHAFVYVGNGEIVEAEPHGAILSSIEKYPTAIMASGRYIPDALAGLRIAQQAKMLLGTPYGYLDIIAIALAQRKLGGLVRSGLPWHEQPWVIKRIENPSFLICSELVDQAYLNAGVHLFNDGRIPGLVSPGDLLNLIEGQ